MKNRDYRLCETKHKLRQLKERRVKSVIWKLSRQQREYIEGLGYEVIPYLYEIHTKTFKNLSSVKEHKLREVHYSNKAGKKTIVMQLSKNEMRTFEEYGIRFRPIKFKILIAS